MKILVTGRTDLASALHRAHHDDNVALVSRSSGHDITMVEEWGDQFIGYDLVYNCAYDGFGQVSVLEFFHDRWKDDQSKIIVNIGSRVTYFPRLEDDKSYWPYQVHKQTLQQVYEKMLPGSRCDIKLINPGPIDTDMIKHLSCDKLDPGHLALRIKDLALDPIIKRVDLWL